jgi:phytoene dehydrogenase-like protein
MTSSAPVTTDIVAIGSGHNGLVAAAYLAAAGRKVIVLERNAWFGGGVVTRELTLPGFRHDQHSMSHIFIQANPLLANDELKLKSRFGLEYIFPEVPMMSVFEDGQTLKLYRDREKSAAEIAKYTKKDAETIRARLGKDSAKLLGWTGDEKTPDPTLGKVAMTVAEELERGK